MKNLWKNLSYFYQEDKKKYILLIIIMLVVAYANTLTPQIIGIIIDQITQNTLTLKALIMWGGTLIAVICLIYGLNMFFHLNLNYSGQKMSQQLRINYLKKLFASDIDLTVKYNKGELISRMTNDLEAITRAATTLVGDLTYCIALIIAIFLQMTLTISLKLTLVAFMIIPLTFILLIALLNYMRKYYFEHRKIFAKFFDKIFETIEGNRVIRAYCYEEEDIKKNKEAIENDINSWKRLVRFETIFTPLFELVIAISTIITFIYGIYLIMNGEISPGDLITFAMYISMLSWPLLVLANVFNIFNQAIIASDRFADIINYQSKQEKQIIKTSINHFKTINYENVSYHYPFDQVNVLSEINMTIKSGQTIGIVGPSASGKSTLIKQLLCDFNLTGGKITIDNQNLEDLDVKDVRDLVGYVPQVDILFSGTVDDNLKIAYQDADMQMKYQAIDIADMNEDLRGMPNGINTLLGEGGNGLSGGQKQRLSIARAILKNPEILILDDSLSAVDANTEKRILMNLEKYRKNKTNIIITHRFSAIKKADIIYVLEDGKISTSGTHEQLIKSSSWYQQQYFEQIGSENESL